MFGPGRALTGKWAGGKIGVGFVILHLPKSLIVPFYIMYVTKNWRNAPIFPYYTRRYNGYETRDPHRLALDTPWEFQGALFSLFPLSI